MTHVETRSRIAALDGLRGLAAVVVVLAHFLSRGPSLYPEIGNSVEWMEVGGRGVELFFLISGFVIYRSVSKGSLYRFGIARFIRLYPLYWLCLALTFSIVALFGLPGREVSFGAFVVNFSMIQGYVGIDNVDGAYWTLAVELAFYIQIAFLWGIGFLRRFPQTTLLVWLAICFTIRAISEGGFAPIGQIPGIYTLNWMPWFICGVALSYLYSGSRNLGMVALPLIACAGVAFFSPVDGLFFALFIVLIYFVLFIRPLGLNSGFFVWLGSISYALYLLHQNIGYVAMRQMARMDIPSWFGVILAVLIVTGLSWLSTEFFDSPVRRFLSRKLVK